MEHRLTASQTKHDLYSRDPYFREAWADAHDVWRARTDAVLRQIAVVVFKPETVVTRRIGAALAFLRARGFVPMLSRRIRYTRHLNRAAWRYQYQSDLPTVDRLAVNDLVLAATEALCVVFRDEATAPDQAASVRLNTFKGSMTPALRGGNDLRSLIAGPNRMLSGVHAPDEPADVLRELGILFDTEERRALFAAVQRSLTADVTATVAAEADSLMRHYAPVTLDPPAALARLDGILRERAARGSDEAAAPLRGIVAAVRQGDPLPWHGFLTALTQAGIDLPLWDKILLGTEFIRHNEE